MNRYLSSADLKDMAKDRLAGHYGLLIGANMAINLISFGVSFFLQLFIPVNANTLAGFILSEAVSFIISVFLGVFNVGTSLLYLKFFCGSKASFSDIFYGFSHHMETALGISLMMSVITLPMSLSYSIPSFLFMQTDNYIYLILWCVCPLASLLIYVPLSLYLAQCFYLMLDFPDKSASEIIRLSIRVMKGHKGRLFYMEASFVPLLLLGTLSGIGLLWVTPYMNMTRAAFYFDIMKKTEQKN